MRNEDRNGLVRAVTFVEGLVYVDDTWFARHWRSDSTLGGAARRAREPRGGLR